MPNTKRKEKQFFTLIELLVVIAIIAVLAGMLLPALNNARVTSRTVQCKHQLKQVALSYFQYVSDNQDNMLPFYFKRPEINTAYKYYWNYLLYENGYNRDNRLYFCPEVDVTNNYSIIAKTLAWNRRIRQARIPGIIAGQPSASTSIWHISTAKSPTIQTAPS